MIHPDRQMLSLIYRDVSHETVFILVEIHNLYLFISIQFKIKSGIASDEIMWEYIPMIYTKIYIEIYK